VDTPLYQLLQVMVPESDFGAVDASWRQGGKGYGEYKKTLLAAYHATFGEARARYQALQKDPGSVDAVLRAGAERARAVAAPVIERVRRAVGIER
jgi:tryptophanyl-tRNA synthetase